MNDLEKKFGYVFLDSVMDFIRDNYNPEDIFSEKTLKQWAENNGYIPDGD